MKKTIPWWHPQYGFFGTFYMIGDDSFEGFLVDIDLTLEERTIREVKGVMNLLGLKKGDRLLDVPCGYGRHSILLAQHGIIPTGVDINKVHLNRAIYQAKIKKLNIKFRKINMLDIAYDNNYHAVINMFYSFGFFETDVENEKVLKNIFRALKPGGKFLMHTDVNIPRINSGKYLLTEYRELPNCKTLLIEEKYNRLTKRMEGIWRIHDRMNNSVTSKNYSVRVYTTDEFTKLCEKVGFKEVKVYSNWNGDTYSPDSEEVIFISTK
jgi:ubiquinone/menaquinone biosynthesis C-methylase UbiE